MSEAVLAKHEALLLRLMRIESAEEFYDEVDTAAGTWLEDLGLRDAIAKLALQDAGQGAADYVVGAWERARKRKAEADAFFKTASNTQSEHNIEEPAPALQPEWLQWQIENPGKELRPAEAFMAAVAAGDRARADAIATDVVHELEGTPDVGKVEWWFRQEIERAWPPAKEPEEEGFEFHESDKAGEEPPITIEERDRLVAELAGLYKSKPFEYAEEKKKLAKRLGVPQDVVHKMAIAHRQREPKGDEDHEQSQATKVMAIGFGFRLWRSPDREGYASIKIGDHYENYRIQSSAFETLVLAKYGERHQGKIGDEWYPQIPSDAALKAGMKGIASRAVHRGQEFEPAVRVGGTPGVVWLDLGRDDWRVVKITREGWNVVPAAEVAFIRTNSMRPLPIPVRGGNVRSLLRVMNVREEDFVLMAGWLLQTINPKGPYAILYLNGLSEAGKSTVSKLALRTVDPDALNRHRGKGQQKVTVEHVHVHAGGQAVVGMVEGPGGGDRPKLEDQPRAKQIAHAPQPAV